MSVSQPSTPPAVGRFGAGLTEVVVRRFQSILREQCGNDLPLPEAWSRAIELLSLVELLLEGGGVITSPDPSSTAVRAPSLLTDSQH
jgi:hypothetical protein